jgi:hypothetical protein
VDQGALIDPVGEPLGDPASGLDPYHQTSTNSEVADELLVGPGCPSRRGMVFLNLTTGQVVPARCGKLSCAYCAKRNAYRRSLAIALAKPERALTLTLVADADEQDPWAVARRRVNRTREWLKRMNVDPGQWVTHVEPNPQGTGFHAHIWQHGSFIAKAALQEAGHHAGTGWTRVERVRQTASAASYGLKGMSYGLKGVTGQQDASTVEYLRVNGGRLTHQSRAFFRGADGETLPVRQAEYAALRANGSITEGAGTWTIMTESGARSFLSVRPGKSRRGPALDTPTPGTAPVAGSPAVPSELSHS